MDIGLQEIKDFANVSSNAALLMSVYFIHQNTKQSREVAERLARIEALADIHPKEKENGVR